MPRLSEDKKQFTTRISTDVIEIANEFIEVYEEQYGVNLSSDRKILEALIESALSKKKPVEKSMKTDLEEIENLKTFVLQLKTKLENSENKLTEAKIRITELVASQLNAESKVVELSNKVSSRIKLDDNQVIVTLSQFHQKLVNTYLKDKKTVLLFEEMNKGGKLNGVFDKINCENNNENIANFLTSILVGSAANKVLRPILTKKTIENEIKNYINDK